MKKGAKRKVSAISSSVQREFPLAAIGVYFDLQTIFDRLNAEYFSDKLTGYRIFWGRRRRLRPVRYLVYGTIQEEDRLIRIHPLLDAPFVPQWFVEYVVFHEMLHAVVPDQVYPSGRRKVHTAEFAERERKYRHFKRAQRWEAQNLGRFLR